MWLEKPDIFYRVLQGVGSCSDNQRQSGRMLLCNLENLHLFLITQARSFTSGSKGNKEVNATGNLPVDQSRISIVINRAVLEWSYKCCTTASEFCCIHIVKIRSILQKQVTEFVNTSQTFCHKGSLYRTGSKPLT